MRLFCFNMNYEKIYYEIINKALRKELSGNKADDGASLDAVLKEYKFVKKHVDAFIKAAEEAKRRGADTVVRCNADNFHYNTVEGYEDA